MPTYSVADVAAHLTKISGEYYGTHRVVKAVNRLVQRGALTDRRAGRARIFFEDELQIIEAAFGLIRVPNESTDGRS